MIILQLKTTTRSSWKTTNKRQKNYEEYCEHRGILGIWKTANLHIKKFG